MTGDAGQRGPFGRLVMLFLAQALTALGLVQAVGLSEVWVLAFAAGLMLFGANGLILGWVAHRMLRGGSTPTPGGVGWVVVGLAAKLAILGGGNYLALVWLDLPVWGLLGGAVAALAFLALAALAPEIMAARNAVRSGV